MVYLFSFLIPGFIWLLSTAFSGIFPFGRNTILTSDMQYQYIGYFEFIQNILRVGTDAFFSFSKGLGEETLGMISYYMASPFNLLVGLFPKENITEAILLINLLKIAASGLTFSIFIKHHFKEKNINPFMIVAFSACYALMAYNIAYQFNIMWLDAVVWLPLIILGIDRMIKSKKSELFYISLTIALISNWYIGFMICVFAIFYFCYLLTGLKDKKEIFSALKKFVFFGILSAGTALVVLIPAAFTCFNELERTEMSGNPVINYKLIDIFSKFVLGAFSFEQIADLDYSAEYLNLPNLFAGTIVLALYVIYFFNESFDKKERIRDGIFGVLLLTMTLIAPLNKIWHAFTYNVWFPYRYSFCISFYMIFIACKSFSRIDDIELKKIFEILLGIIGVYFIIEKLEYSYISSELIYCSIFIILAVYIAIKLLRSEMQKYTYILLSIVICIECFLNTVVYMGVFDYYSRDEFYEKRLNLSENISEIKANVRIEQDITNDYNTAMGKTYMGITSSTSMGNENIRGFLEALGYTRVSNNQTKYQDTTKFADSFLGIKYYIANEVKENNDALSLGFTVNNSLKNIENFLAQWGEHVNSFEKQNELIKESTGLGEDLYKPLEIIELTTENLEKKDKNSYTKIYSDIGGSYSFCFNAINENNVYLKLNGNTLENTILYVNGEKITDYMGVENYSIINIGKFKANEKVEVKLDVMYDDYIEINDVWLYYEDITVYDKAISILKQNQLNIEKMSGASLEGKIDVNKKEQLLLFTVPYDDNLKIYIDGKERECLQVLDALIATPIEEGEHTVKVCYIPKHLYISLIISGVFLVISTFAILLEYKGKKEC